MKNIVYQSLPIICYGLVFSFLLGCLQGCHHATETMQTSTVSESANGRQELETKTVQTRRGPHGKVIVEESIIKEKAICVDRKGNRLKCNTYEQCIKAGGRVIEEETIGERVHQHY